MQYPVAPDQMPEIEEQLNLKINIFSFFDDEGKGRYPLYISRREHYRQEIDLLYWDEHYAWIKNFQSFIYDISPSHRAKVFCKRCFGVFLSPETYQQHTELCSRPDFDSIIYRFPPPETMIKFSNIKYQLQAPFVIYADFECLLEKGAVDPQNGKRQRTTLYQKHIPCSAGIFITCAQEEVFKPRYETYTGRNVCKWLLERLFNLSEELMNILEDGKRIQMTEEDTIAYNQANFCWICNRPFDQTLKPFEKVRDHDHLTGKFRGAAHSKCNLKLQQNKKIPVFLHNFRGYDAHLIALATEFYPDVKLKIIGQSYEKYLILGFGPFIVFKDSYQFLAYSLEQLANELRKAGAEKFSNLHKEFPNTDKEKIQLLLRKGVYPYEYMDEWAKLEKNSLPTREEFYNSLKQEECTPEEYAHAKNVWEKFECKTMQDYQDLYLKTDVLILADVFENFRNFSIKHYKLDPAHYVSSPQLSWDAMLLFTECKLEMISDPEIFVLVDKGIRGGVAMISHRYAKANNPEMGIEYDMFQDLSYIVYLDANNLYGWAMSEPMPISDFKWRSPKDFHLIDWKNLPDESDVGYIIECDLEYPNYLHDLHNDYPLAPEKILMQYEMLNEYQLKILKHYAVPKSSLKVQKLVPHLMARQNYVIHYRNLKFYLEEGMQLKNIHKVLQFKQSRWLSPYIKKNQDLRAAATSEFEKNQPKLYNNAIYGKTCENQKKRSDIKLVNTKEACKRLLEKPQLKGFKIFSDNLAAIDLRKVQAKIDKPFYVGFTVLELSKLHMYKFHYRYIKKKFGAKAQLLFTDTDSLMYHISGCNPYDQFYHDRAEYFDFASFPANHRYYDKQNNKVIGKFKDEANGNQIYEFVGLRPKMYSFLMANEQTLEVQEKHRAKGIQYAAAKKLRHSDFLEQLNNPHENHIVNRRIGSKLHQLYSMRTDKRGLCAFDDKRVLLEDGITTLAYGHYKVTAEEVDIGLPENELPRCQTMRAERNAAMEERLLQSMPANFKMPDALEESADDETEFISDCLGEWDIA